MAMFLANRIIKGQTTLANVPSSLKAAVAEILTTEGHSNLIAEPGILVGGASDGNH